MFQLIFNCNQAKSARIASPFFSSIRYFRCIICQLTYKDMRTNTSFPKTTTAGVYVIVFNIPFDPPVRTTRYVLGNLFIKPSVRLSVTCGHERSRGHFSTPAEELNFVWNPLVYLQKIAQVQFFDAFFYIRADIL